MARMNWTWAAAMGAVTLAGCAKMQEGPAAFEDVDVAMELRQSFQAAYQDTPFDAGPIWIVAPEGDEMQTFVLLPCGDGRVCSEARPHHRGHVVRTGEYYVVTGAYPRHDFWLSPGGDGWLAVGGVGVPLAWDDS